jgi:transposase InsO family protein
MGEGKEERGKYTSEQKYKIVKEVLTTDTTVTEVCKKYGIVSSLFYKWQEAFLQGARDGMSRGGGGPWHTDIAYIKVRGVFYFLIMVLDGFSRYVLDWELMRDMLGKSVEDFIQRVKDQYPDAKPKLIHDNGSQFISIDFKKLVTRLEIQQVFTRRNHPQTNGKAERWNGLVKQEAIRPRSPESFQEAWNVIDDFVVMYNNRRLHAGIKFLRPPDMFFGRADPILSHRKERLASARTYRLAINNRRDLSSFDA